MRSAITWSPFHLRWPKQIQIVKNTSNKSVRFRDRFYADLAYNRRCNVLCVLFMWTTRYDGKLHYLIPGCDLVCKAHRHSARLFDQSNTCMRQFKLKYGMSKGVQHIFPF